MMNKAMKRHLSMLLAVTMLMQSLAGASWPIPALAQASEATITPREIRLELTPGQLATRTITVTTAETPIPKVDVLLLFDVTGSMSDEIRAAKENASYIMDAVRAKVPDAAFGVASFVDYPHYYDYAGYADEYGAPGDYPWSLDLDITTDTGAVQRTLNALELGNGKDGPECYSRALFEAILVSWRAGAKKVIVLFGDSVPHDTGFFQAEFGVNTGVDPGEDEEPGTGDDLVFTEVVARLREQRIEVIPINSAPDFEEAVASFGYLAAQTGGQVFNLAAATEAPEAVVRGLEAATERIKQLTILPDEAFILWVTAAPATHHDVGGGESRSFEMTITVSEDTSPGPYEFNLTVLGDGARLGVVHVVLGVGPRAPELPDGAQLLKDKRALSQFLDSPQVTLRVLDTVDIPYDPGGYFEVEPKVMEWVDTLEKGAGERDLTVAEVMALQRLVWQEEGVKVLFEDQITMAHSMGEHVGNIASVAWSLIKAFKFLDHVSRKHVVGRLVTKIRHKVEAKLVDIIQITISAIGDTIPDETVQTAFKAGAWAACGYVKEQLDKGMTIEEVLMKGGAALVLDNALDGLFVQLTKDDVEVALERAQMFSQQTLEPVSAVRENEESEARIDSLVDPAHAKTKDIERTDREVRSKQEVTKIATDVADVASLVSTASGVGGVVGAILKGLAIATRVVDALFSSTVIVQAGWHWASLPATVEDLTEAAFPAGTALWPEGAAVRAHSLVPAESIRELSVADAPLITSRPMARYAGEALQRVRVRSAEYESVLQRLAEAVRRGDQAELTGITEELLIADDALSQELATARTPIFAGAVKLIAATGSDELYPRLAAAVADFDLQGVWLYALLLQLLSQPGDPTAQESLLTQIKRTVDSLQTYETALEEALPAVTDHLKEPVVSLSSYRLSEVSPERELTLTLTINNPLPGQAQSVQVTLTEADNLEFLSSPALELGNMDGGSERSVEFRLRLSAGAEATVMAVVGVSNGRGDQRLIYISIFEEAISPPEETAPLPIAPRRPMAWVFLLLVAGGLLIVAAAVYLYSQRAPTARPVAEVAHASLRVQQGVAQPSHLPLQKQATTIGRGPGNDMSIGDRRVSRHHSRIRREGPYFILEDLVSVNGTFLNGQRITQARLYDGDIIRVGDTELMFQGPMQRPAAEKARG